ncbi:Sps2 protein [Pichia kluyveri]|uniref:Sps2 protein n=1 Tax=Pichia kluyveri TaxID=36015 RepID=A0AAV5QYQ6_PICKL|nr:Sps2 protein [Pichia kluyveri]
MKFNCKLCFSTFVLLNTCLASKFVSQSEKKGATLVTDVQPKCFKSEYNIRTAGDLAAISDCAVISGSIHVSDFDSDTLYLGSIKEVKGDLTVKNCSSLLRMEGPSLNSVGGMFELNTLNSLTSLSFPKLESVETLKWKVLPILTFVNFDSGIKKINSVIMSDTSLTGFGGFNVETLKTLNINNNRFLERIESTVSEITEELLISANARNIRVSLPNLVWVKTLTVKDTEDINLESLQIVEKSADFSHNKFTKLDLPNMKSTGNTLSIINNKNLKDVNFDKLSEVGGGLMIIDNDQIDEIDFFSSLRSVGGAIEFHGNIKSNHFNDLKIIKGSAIMKSSSESFDCSDWMKNEVARVVRGGKVECGSGKSSTTEVLLVDESGESTQGEPGINDNNKNTSNKESFLKQKNGASSNWTTFSKKFAMVVSVYSIGILLQLL